MKIIVIPVTKDHKDIVMSTWLKGNYYGNHYFRGMNQNEYFEYYSKHVSDVINTPGTMIDVAVLEDDHNTVLGYIVYNDQVVHWAYVKRDYRKQGICRTLLKDMDFTTSSSTTPVGASIMKKYELNFNPFKLR